MKNFEQVKQTALNSGSSEAKTVLEFVSDLEAQGDDDSLICSSLHELANWAAVFEAVIENRVPNENETTCRCGATAKKPGCGYAGKTHWICKDCGDNHTPLNQGADNE